MKEIKKIVLIVFSVFLGSAYADEIKKFDNLNVSIHDINKQAEMEKAQLDLTNLNFQRSTASRNRIFDNMIVDNNNTIRRLESEYKLLLNKEVFSVKNGTKNVSDIDSPFIKKKVYSLLLSDQNRVEEILAESEMKDEQIDLLNEQIFSRDKEITSLNTKILEIFKINRLKLKKATELYDSKISKLKKELRLASNIHNEVVVEEVAVEEEILDKTLIIKGINVKRKFVMGNNIKLTLSIDYIIPLLSDEVVSTEVFTISKSKRLLIKNYGNILVVPKDEYIGFYVDDRLLDKIIY